MRRPSLALLLVVGGAWHLALKASGWRLPLLSDEGEYAYAARVWSQGGLPYRDAVLQKPPMIVGLYRLCAAAGGGPRAPRGLAALATLAALALLSACTPRSWSPWARAAPAFAYASLAALPVGDYAFPANTEVFVCAFAALAAWAVTRAWEARESAAARWAALAGLACGAAFATKQTSLYTALALGVLSAWTGPGRWRPGRAAAFLAGAAVVPAAWAAYFALRGGLGPLVEYAFRRNASYVSVVGYEQLAEQGRWLAGWLGPLLLRGAWPALALAALGLSGTQARWSGRHGVLATLWLGAAAAGVMTGLLLFPHYFLQAAPALALAAALGVERLARRRGALAAAACAGLALVPAAAYAPAFLERDPGALARALLYPNPLTADERLGRELGAATRPDETLYVVGSEPQIYVYAGRRCATANTFSYVLTLARPRDGEVDAELERLRAARPAFVVYSRQPLSTLVAHAEGARFVEDARAWLRRDYRLVEEVRVGPDGDEFRPVLKASPALGSGASEPPDFSAADSLLVFERRDRVSASAARP